MKVIGKLAQTAAALWIINVWFNRFNKDTGYRGGDAKNMKARVNSFLSRGRNSMSNPSRRNESPEMSASTNRTMLRGLYRHQPAG